MHPFKAFIAISVILFSTKLDTKEGYNVMSALRSTAQLKCRIPRVLLVFLHLMAITSLGRYN